MQVCFQVCVAESCRGVAQQGSGHMALNRSRGTGHVSDDRGVWWGVCVSVWEREEAYLDSLVLLELER